MKFRFERHPELEGRHAVLSPSGYHWLRYDAEKMRTRYRTLVKAARGTEEHELAAKLIRMNIKLADNGTTLNMYVNDCIGYRMVPEQPLYFSDNCFGTADAISFAVNPKTGNLRLRVFDLKTGVTKASVDQLLVYVAIFCMQYEVDINDIELDLRIYQNDMIQTFEVDPTDILQIMQTIRDHDKTINEVRMEDML